MRGRIPWSERPGWTLAAIVAAVVVVIVGLAYLLRGVDPPREPIRPVGGVVRPAAPVLDERQEVAAPDQETDPVAAPQAVEPPQSPPVSEPVAEPIALPPLADSDAFVRGQLASEIDVSGIVWLAESDLIARAAAVIVNGAVGDIPTRLLATTSFARLPGRFTVEEAGGVATISPSSYRRYDVWVATATSIPPARAAGMALRLEPLLGEAVRALGSTEPPLALIDAMLAEVLRTPVIERPLGVEKRDFFYRYQDPELEGLLPLQKQMLRMGPANVRAVKAYARILKAELAI